MLHIVRNKTSAIRKGLTVLLFAVVLLAPVFVFAQNVTQDQVTDFGISDFGAQTQLSNTDIRIIIARIINTGLGLLGIITVCIFLYAGYQYMFSGGDESKIESSRKTMINAVIGIAIIFSALAIVQFVMRALRDATGLIDGANNGGTTVTYDSYYGSGGLGHVIQDHYPFRDQEGVARNTKIAITFRDDIDVRTITRDDNPVAPGLRVGECNATSTFDWSRDCNQLDTQSIVVFELPRGAQESDQETICRDMTVTPTTTVAAAVSVAYETATGTAARTVVLRPLTFLGDQSVDTRYCVRITDAVKKANGDDVFTSRYPAPYIWKFGVSTQLDLTPPYVSESVPKNASAIYRNTIVSLSFNEPMDPTSAQGSLDGRSAGFTNILFDTLPDGTSVTGTWNITNAYQTVEFLPNLPCGNNSCGEVMYCLPVGATCEGQGTSCSVPFGSLARTAATIGSTWEAVPFTGITDMAGNALDATPLGIRQGKPTVGTPPWTIGAGEKVPDNFSLNFSVRNEIDYSVPYVAEITPAVDEENVRGDVPLVLRFSHVMWLRTIEGLELLEEGTVPDGKTLDPIWFVPRSVVATDSVDSQWTRTTILHREFGPNQLDLFYFMSTPTTLRANNQNCMYPGRGPSVAGTPAGGDGQHCSYSVGPNGAVVSEGCVPVSAMNSDADTGCAYDGNQAQSDVASCYDALRDASGIDSGN